MQTIYTTKEWKGYGKQNYFWNEYRTDGETVTKVRCNRVKSFDGKENAWERSEKPLESWNVADERLPKWLKAFL